jgi:spore maturation protein CgeB
MRILFAVPGNLRTVPMGRYIGEALRGHGHEVVSVDYSPTLREKIAGRFIHGRDRARMVDSRMLAAVESTQPDLFFTLYGINVSRKVLAQLDAKNVTTVNWWLNDPFQFERAMAILPLYKVRITNAKYSVDAYRNRGVRDVLFLPTACHPPVHRPVAADEALRSDISFAGDWSANRERVVASLLGQKQWRIRVFGPWRKKVAPRSPILPCLTNGFFGTEKMVSIFASSKATLNIHTWRGKADFGLNPRVFEAAACGVPQIVDWKRELDEIFSPEARDSVFVYRDDDDLLSQCRAAMADAASAKARSMAVVDYFHREHSYAARIRELFKTIGG